VFHGAAAFAADLGAAPGRAIFRSGLLPDGALLHGERDAGADVDGAAAACAVCHRRSGLGSVEGSIVVPPIIGKYLLRPHATNVSDSNMPHVLGYRSTRDSYTVATLARAIREGINPNGRALNYLMPRYRLKDSDMASLIEYLSELDTAPVPGVGDDVLHFATIITPDADPRERQGMLDVMTQFIADKNSFIRGGIRTIAKNSREIQYRVSRRWQLHVWDLTGPPDTWGAQLRDKLAAEPVFAVISGLGRGSWAPVHLFCEQAEIPCLFPNVDQPVVAEQDFYALYYSRGVLLEGDLMVAQISADKSARPRRVVQLYKKGDIGEAAAGSVQAAAAKLGLPAVSRSLNADGISKNEVRNALADVRPDDALVLWLRPRDLAELPPEGTASKRILLSGILGDMEQSPIPAWWRANARMTYVVDLPEQRRVRLDFPMGWFRIHNIALVSERVQVDTYVACGIVSEMLSEMLDSFVRDYLIEKTETMLSHRLVNGYYPRLSLAPGQRFASKGGYIVHFAGPSGTQIVADTEWTVP
jgi:Cytochrome c